MVGGISPSCSSNSKASDFVTSKFLEIRQGPRKAVQLRERAFKSIHKPPHPSQIAQAQTLSHTNTNEFTNLPNFTPGPSLRLPTLTLGQRSEVRQIPHNTHIHTARVASNKQIKQSTFSKTNNMPSLNKLIQYNCFEAHTFVKHKTQSIEEHILRQTQTQQTPTSTHIGSCNEFSQASNTVSVTLPPTNSHIYIYMAQIHY